MTRTKEQTLSLARQIRNNSKETVDCEHCKKNFSKYGILILIDMKDDDNYYFCCKPCWYSKYNIKNKQN